MDFDDFIARGWTDHASDPAAVAARLHEGLSRVGQPSQIPVLTQLVHHVHGEHLGDWASGLSLLERIAGLPAFEVDGPSGQAQRRAVASLRLSQGDAAALAGLGKSDCIRVAAMAAANLAERDTPRAAALFRDALAAARASALPNTDPMHRALASTANGLACTFEAKPTRSAGERALMIEAARAARVHWALAGTWLEVERAEYRLAISWLHAGDPVEARVHADACLAIVEANDGAALERLFAWEARGRCARAAGDLPAHADAVAQARMAFDALADDDKAGCRASLTALAAPTGV